MIKPSQPEGNNALSSYNAILKLKIRDRSSQIHTPFLQMCPRTQRLKSFLSIIWALKFYLQSKKIIRIGSNIIDVELDNYEDNKEEDSLSNTSSKIS